MDMSFPLLPGYRADDPLAWHDGEWVTAKAFRADVAHLAARLPARAHVLNLCDNRYHFLVAFAAALTCGQLTLLPPNRTPTMLAQLRRAYPDFYCIAEQGDVVDGVEMLHYERRRVTLGDYAPIEISGGTVAALLFTSGSTGEPQPHAKTWRSLVTVARRTAARFQLNRGAAIVATVPPQHMYGLETSIMLALQSGSILHSGRPFFPQDIRVALEAMNEPRILVTTPVHLRACVAEKTRLPPIAFVLSATAPLALALAQATESLCSAPVHEIYGCTEAGTIATRRSVAGELWLALEGIHVHGNDAAGTIESDHLGAPVALNDVIQARSPTQFVLCGRKSDLINIAGKRMSLSDLNHKLGEIPGVMDGVFVMPEESDDALTRLIVFVVAPGRTREYVLEALRQRVDPVFLPRPLYIVARLPRNATGKLTRNQLLGLAAQHDTVSGTTRAVTGAG